MMTRTIVVGLDAGTFGVINPMVAAGKLPNIAALMDQGIHGVLRSTMPPITCPAWPTMFTGQPPEKLGLMGLLTTDDNGVRPVRSTDIHYPTVWDTATENGVGSVIIGVPITYPPKPIRGKMVSGFMTPPGKTATYPPGLAKEIGSFQNYLSSDVIRPKAIVRDAVRWIEKTTDVCLFTMRYNTEPYKFLAVVFSAVDQAQHRIWTSYPKGVEQVYEAADRAIGRIVAMTPDPKNFLIVSDHGFDTFKENFFYVDRWLYDRKYLNVQKTASLSWETLREIARRVGLNPDVVTRVLPPALTWRLPEFNHKQDRKQSLAYVDEAMYLARTFGIRINRDLIRPEDYKTLRSLIILQLKDSVPVSKAVRGEEFFDKSVAPRLPDIMAVLAEPDMITQRGLNGPQYYRKTEHEFGGHDMDGIFIAAGPDVKDVAFPLPIKRVHSILLSLLGLSR